MRALIVDYGGVLTTSVAETLRVFLSTEGIAPDRFRATMRAWVASVEPNPWHELERGRLDYAEFEQQLVEQLGEPRVAHGVLGRMLAAGAAVDDLHPVLRRARAHGIRTALLTNSLGVQFYVRDAWDELFDVVVVSGEVGLRKPDAAIYEQTAQRLGVAPADCVFVDDLAENVEGAEAAGMTGVLHVDAAATVARLSSLLELPTA